MVDVVTELERKGALSEFLFVYDLVLMGETVGAIRNKFRKLKLIFQSKGLKVNIGKNLCDYQWRHYKV